MVTGSRPLSRDTHLISISLQLTQRMMFLYPKLMRVFTEFPNISQIIEIVFLKLKNERIQSKVAQTFLDISKKLDQDLSKAIMLNSTAASQESSAASESRVPDEVSSQLPSVFFMRLFWQQYLN